MIKYVNSKKVDYDFIKDVIQIDSLVYPQELQGTYESVKTRFNKNKESYILAYQGNLLVGYICFFPLKQSTYDKVINDKEMYDDNLTDEDIVSYDKKQNLNIFIISIAVRPEYQKREVGKTLTKEMFTFLDVKRKEGVKINNIVAEAVTVAGRTILNTFNFHKRCSINNKYDLYTYEYNDFSKTKILGFIPCIPFSKLNEKMFENNEFINVLNEISFHESDQEFSNSIKRYKLKKQVNYVIHNDEKQEVKVVNANIYINIWKDLATVILELSNIYTDPTYILDNFSTKTIYFSENNKKMSLEEFLNELNMKASGEIKALITDYKDYTINHKMCILVGEQFSNGYIAGYQIISKEIKQKAINNIANYDFADIFVSKKNVIYILSDKVKIEERLYYEALMIYIMEVLSLQINVISNSNAILLKSLNSSDFKEDLQKSIDKETAKTAYLWEIEIFKYYLAQHLYNILFNEFNINNLKQTYLNNYKVYEVVKRNYDNEVMKKANEITQNYFSLFTILSGFSTINTIIGLVFSCFVKEEALKSIIILGFGLVSIICFIILFIISKKIKNTKR